LATTSYLALSLSLFSTRSWSLCGIWGSRYPSIPNQSTLSSTSVETATLTTLLSFVLLDITLHLIDLVTITINHINIDIGSIHSITRHSSPDTTHHPYRNPNHHSIVLDLTASPTINHHGSVHRYLWPKPLEPTEHPIQIERVHAEP
jgi:hypothetical protein